MKATKLAKKILKLQKELLFLPDEKKIILLKELHNVYVSAYMRVNYDRRIPQRKKQGILVSKIDIAKNGTILKDNLGLKYVKKCD